jgi:hypothetical protein
MKQARRAATLEEQIAHGERVLAPFARHDPERPQREGNRPLPQFNFGGLKLLSLRLRGGLRSRMLLLLCSRRRLARKSLGRMSLPIGPSDDERLAGHSSRFNVTTSAQKQLISAQISSQAENAV